MSSRLAGVEQKLQSAVNWIVRTARVLAVVAAGLGLLCWLIVRGWLNGPVQFVAFAGCLVPAIAFLVLPLFVRRVHDGAKQLIGSLRGQGEKAKAELPRLQAAVDRFQHAKRWSKFIAGRELVGELNTARSIVTDVTGRAVDVQASGGLAGWSFAIGFLGILVLVFVIPLFAIARLLV